MSFGTGSDGYAVHRTAIRRSAVRDDSLIIDFRLVETRQNDPHMTHQRSASLVGIQELLSALRN
jgi:hypothetical protein